jgi:glycosyltransferase involved in cell wall biosynthesis
LDAFKNQIFEGKKYDFVFHWSNRNIRRKQASDVIWAYDEFCKKLTPEQKDKVLLLMHTQPVDENGTDLPAVIARLSPTTNIKFSTGRLSTEQLNQILNISDVSINICGNEGFGLGTAESVMAGTPIIVLTTGGLQDQCGFRFKDSGELITHEDYYKIGSLHNWREWEDKVTWGEWVKPLWARAQTMTGSVPTPYIIDDKIDIQDLANAMKYWYDIPKEERKKMGMIGHEFFMTPEYGYNAKRMCQTLIDGMEGAFENWKPRKRFDLFKIKE